MKAEFSFLNSRLSGLESSTKVRVDPVPPSPESQEDEVDREDDEISVVLKVAKDYQQWGTETSKGVYSNCKQLETQ
jgi:hypothetical protein